MGTGVGNICPSRAYKASDGKWVNMTALDEGAWQKLCATLGLTALATDKRLQSNAGRVEHRAEVDGAIESAVESAFQRYESQRIARANTVVLAARRFGVIGQLSNPLAAWARDSFTRLMPENVVHRQLRMLWGDGVARRTESFDRTA